MAYDNTFQLKDSTGTLTLANKRKLLFLAFALHTATDAYSHQYVIRPTEYASIRGNIMAQLSRQKFNIFIMN